MGDIIAIAAGSRHTVGLKQDGSLIATGRNDYGQCDVYDLENIVAISAGMYHTIALGEDGVLYKIGSNAHGQCG